VEVSVVDRNDHAPEFEHLVYYLTVAENIAPPFRTLLNRK